MVIAKPQLIPRAEHPVGRHAPHLARGDREAPWQRCSHRSQRNQVTDGEVCGPADDLERTGSGIDDHSANLVSALDGRDLLDLGDHDIVQPLAHDLDVLDDETEIVKRGAQQSHVTGERSELLEP